MNNFKLYILQNNRTIYLSSFDGSETIQHNLSGVYDEELDEQENSQFTLTFSMLGRVGSCSDGVKLNEDSEVILNTENNLPPHSIYHEMDNKLIDLLPVGAKLRLSQDNAGRVIDFVITKISPVPYQQNVEYKFTAQDIVSYQWTRWYNGFSYSTTANGILTAKRPLDIVEDILRRARIADWRTSSRLTSAIYLDQKATLTVDNTNPYNALVELCLLFNANLVVNYKTKSIGLKQKKASDETFSGYRFHPATNIKDLSIDVDGTNLTSILHVSGGTRENGELVTIVPPIPASFYSELNRQLEALEETEEEETEEEKSTAINFYSSEFTQNTIEEREFLAIARAMPHLGQYLINFDYFKNKKLLDEDTYKILLAKFNKELQVLNVKLKLIDPNYYNFSYDTFTVQTQLESYAEQYAAMREKLSKEESDGTIPEVTKQKIWDIITQMHDYMKGDGRGFYEKHFHLYGTDDWTAVADSLYDKKIEEYTNLCAEAKNKLADVQDQQETSDGNLKAQYEADIEYYNSKINIYNTYLYSGNGFPSVFDLLKSVIIDNGYDIEGDSLNIIATRDDLNTQIRSVWDDIYMKYGDYIYESYYDNTDEFDSVSLYNQAIATFDQQKKPNTTYGITVLDIRQLESINIPRLEVGNQIKVWEEVYGIDGADLLITNIKTKLRNPDSIQIGVEDANPYKRMVEKLLQTLK